ncbi:S1 RNA-binding domain-containing protein [Streptomyces sp. NPDC051000]|uniref:S1 RNA-binding domain-containing protein n=1 Tax=Streptomyces sp. NPDC051000 TaxID=3155520 RepID=UPI0033FADE75
MEFKPGQVCKGVVSQIGDAGLTVTLEGGVRGRVSSANLSWRKVDHPSQVAGIGEEVSVVFLSLDPDRNNISLSMKDLTADPFIEFARTQLGESCIGKVTNVTPIGIFVGLSFGIEGLLPNAGPSIAGIGHVEIGSDVGVEVEYINLQLRQVRISLADHTK